METLNDYINTGWRLDGDRSYQRGYVSRKTDVGKQIVLIAGGRRKGQPYILEPCYNSTKYCFRHYLKH